METHCRDFPFDYDLRKRGSTLSHRRNDAMLVFLIITAVMLAVFALDFRPLLKTGTKRVVALYCALTALSLLILALNSFGADLPGLYGF